MSNRHNATLRSTRARRVRAGLVGGAVAASVSLTAVYGHLSVVSTAGGPPSGTVTTSATGGSHGPSNALSTGSASSTTSGTVLSTGSGTTHATTTGS